MLGCPCGLGKQEGRGPCHVCMQPVAAAMPSRRHYCLPSVEVVGGGRGGRGRGRGGEGGLDPASAQLQLAHASATRIGKRPRIDKQRILRHSALAQW